MSWKRIQTHYIYIWSQFDVGDVVWGREAGPHSSGVHRLANCGLQPGCNQDGQVLLKGNRDSLVSTAEGEGVEEGKMGCQTIKRRRWFT